jgi:ribosome maturation factor RimP
MHQVTPLQAQVETMLRDGFPEVEVLLVEKPSPNRVRVFIDRENTAVDTDLLEQVSRELSPLREQWALEVSSPGIERPLVKLDHYKRVVGSPVAVRTEQPLAGRRSFKGVLTEAHEQMITIDLDGEPVEIPLDAVHSAHLVDDGRGGKP